ncbi:hypothetical protein Dda_1692 [Drechslerella dactyloides]|uniref:Uncharacterized protein n=1 Tax=Drechslerella dactyloides TaxID=74499 RepID=A0AAD6J3I9_DREDA|nr:hypothetical protein Dda_1692 [Drechslerella dactyloides]
MNGCLGWMKKQERTKADADDDAETGFTDSEAGDEPRAHGSRRLPAQVALEFERQPRCFACVQRPNIRAGAPTIKNKPAPTHLITPLAHANPFGTQTPWQQIQQMPPTCMHW